MRAPDDGVRSSAVKPEDEGLLVRFMNEAGYAVAARTDWRSDKGASLDRLYPICLIFRRKPPEAVTAAPSPVHAGS
jgi:hypothetical protein